MDYGLKSSATDLFSFYLKIVENDFPEMFELIDEIEVWYDGIHRLLEIQRLMRIIVKSHVISEEEFTRHNMQLKKIP